MAFKARISGARAVADAPPYVDAAKILMEASAYDSQALKVTAYGTWRTRSRGKRSGDLAWPGGAQVDLDSVSARRKYVRIWMDGEWVECEPNTPSPWQTGAVDARLDIELGERC